MLALLSLSTSTSLRGTPTVVLVIVVVRLQDAFPQLLLSSVDIRVQFVAVLPDRELLVVVDGNVDAASAHRLVLRVVELSHIRVSQCLVCGQTPHWVELQQVSQHIQRVV